MHDLPLCPRGGADAKDASFLAFCIAEWEPRCNLLHTLVYEQNYSPDHVPLPHPPDMSSRHSRHNVFESVVIILDA